MSKLLLQSKFKSFSIDFHGLSLLSIHIYAYKLVGSLIYMTLSFIIHINLYMESIPF